MLCSHGSWVRGKTSATNQIGKTTDNYIAVYRHQSQMIEINVHCHSAWCRYVTSTDKSTECSFFLSIYYCYNDAIQAVYIHVLMGTHTHFDRFETIFHDNFAWSRLNVVYPFAPFICAYNILCKFYAWMTWTENLHFFVLVFLLLLFIFSVMPQSI